MLTAGTQWGVGGGGRRKIASGTAGFSRCEGSEGATKVSAGVQLILDWGDHAGREGR